MHKLLWMSSALGATALTAAVLSMNATPEMSRERAATLAYSPVPAGNTPVVVEFFTSQGCSSCPPSDRLAARLAKEPGVLVIQRPVTYWDRLGWTDTLANPANTDLQRAYAGRGLSGRNGVYTPQAVVGGGTGLVGSNEAALRRTIAATAERGGPAIAVTGKKGGVSEITVGGVAKGKAQVFLVGLDRAETVQVSRGENGGRSLQYTNIWKGERLLGSVAGGEASFMLGTAQRDISGADAYAVIVRQGETGPVLGGIML